MGFFAETFTTIMEAEEDNKSKNKNKGADEADKLEKDLKSMDLDWLKKNWKGEK